MMIEIGNGAVLPSHVVSVKSVCNSGFPLWSDWVSGNVVTTVEVACSDGSTLQETFCTVQEAETFKREFIRKINQFYETL